MYQKKVIDIKLPGGAAVQVTNFAWYKSSDSIKESLMEQIDLYIPELKEIDYELTVSIFDDPQRHQECMEIYFRLSEFDVFLIILNHLLISQNLYKFHLYIK